MKSQSTAALVAAALVLVPFAQPADAHHRTQDRWERRQDHHHGRWVYRSDDRVSQHRRWHEWHATSGGSTGRRHTGTAKLRVESTAYCMSGRMANGQATHTGAAAMNGVPLGTRFRVLTGPQQGEVVTIKDRVGSGSEFDVAMPGACTRAARYGRRIVNIRRL